MKTKKIWANFSLKDASRTNQFYTQLGFKANKRNSDAKLASFLFGDDEFVIHFFVQNSQIDEYLTPGSKNGSEIIFTLSAETEQEVKEWEDKVKGDRRVFCLHIFRNAILALPQVLKSGLMRKNRSDKLAYSISFCFRFTLVFSVVR